MLNPEIGGATEGFRGTGTDPEGIPTALEDPSPCPAPAQPQRCHILTTGPARCPQVSPGVPRCRRDRANTPGLFCQPQIPGKGHARTAGTHPHHLWGFRSWERTHGELSSTRIGVTHVWGCSDSPRLSFAVKISAVKYFSFSLNILDFISRSRFLREGTAALRGHRDILVWSQSCV